MLEDFYLYSWESLKSQLCIRTHPCLDSELPKLPVTRSAPNLTLTSETLTFSHHLVLDREERVLLSWMPNTRGMTLRQSVATHGYIGLEFSPRADTGDMCTWQIDMRWVSMWHTWTRARTITYSDEDPGEGSSPLLYHSLTQRGQRSIYLSEPPAPSQGLGPEGRQSPAPRHWPHQLLVQDILRPGGDHQAPHDRPGVPHPAWSWELRASHDALLLTTLTISHRWRQWGHHLQSKVHICTHNGALTWIAPNYVNPSTLSLCRIMMTEVECFDPLTSEWTECHRLPQSRSTGDKETWILRWFYFLFLLFILVPGLSAEVPRPEMWSITPGGLGPKVGGLTLFSWASTLMSDLNSSPDLVTCDLFLDTVKLLKLWSLVKQQEKSLIWNLSFTILP